MYKKLIWGLEIYLLLSVVLYFFGPLRFPVLNVGKLVFFLALYHISILVGFFIGYHKISMKPRVTVRYSSKLPTAFLFFCGTLIHILFSFLSIFQKVGTVSLSAVINSVQFGFGNAKEAYLQTLELSSGSTGSLITTLTTLLSPLTYAILPLGIYFYRSLNKSNKLMLVIATLLSAVSFFITGTNIGIFRIVVTITAILLLRMGNNEKKLVSKKERPRYRLAVFSIILLIGFIYIFSNNVTSRMFGMGTSISGIPIDFDSWFYKVMPAGLKIPFVLFVSYFSQGYHGMALAMNYEWTSTFPLGSSIFLMSKSQSIGIDSMSFYYDTYIVKMSSLWNPSVNWHTAYTWMANDVSFWGVAIYMFLLGLFLAVTYREAHKGDTLSILLYPLLLLIVIFLPMNNNILSNPLTFMPFFVFITVFIITKQLSVIKK